VTVLEGSAITFSVRCNKPMASGRLVGEFVGDATELALEPDADDPSVLTARFVPDKDTKLRIHLADDGRGLPIADLRTKTGRLSSSDRDVAEAIFDHGVSTARQLSHVSGRGIGMDAVRGFLRERGGDVAIEFTGDTHAGHRPFELVFRLPENATVTP